MRLVHIGSQNFCLLFTVVIMHRRSKPPRKMTERTLTRADIQKMVERIRAKNTVESLQKLEEGTTASTAALNEDFDDREVSSGVNVCIFPCNNPVKHVIAECFKHSKHGGTAASLYTSQSGASEDVPDVTLSACENLLSQISKKIEELQNEVKLYQTQNDNLKSLQQQYHQMLNGLQKDKDKFEVLKRKEMQKLKAEMDAEKHKMRLLTRRKDVGPVVKAKPKAVAPKVLKKAPDSEANDQLQRKLNTVTSENARLKAKLELAEQDKDSLKAMVKELEEQRLSLLEKLERSSVVGCYPSTDSLSASPHAQLIMSGLAQESAQGDSFCREVKAEKYETSFDLSSEVRISEGVARTTDKGSDSVLYAATVVARLSLDNALAVRAPREANSPVVCKRNVSSPIWNSGLYAMEQAELAEERAVKASMGRVLRSAARKFEASQDELVITVPEIHDYLHDSCIRRDNARKSGETESHVYHEPCLAQAGEQDHERLDAVTVPSCNRALQNNTSLQAHGSVDFLKTTTKTGIVTKEVLTGIPRIGLRGLNVTSKRWISSENFGIRNILVQDGAGTVPSLMPVFHEGDRVNSVSTANSVLNAGTSTRTCNPAARSQPDDFAEQNAKWLPVSNTIEAQNMGDDSSCKQNVVVKNFVTKSSQEFGANKPFSTQQQPRGATVASSGIEPNFKFITGHGEGRPQHREEPGVFNTEDAPSCKVEASWLGKHLSAETRAPDYATSLNSKVKQSEQASDKHSEEEAADGLRDILENLPPNNGNQARLTSLRSPPSVLTGPSSKTQGWGLTTGRSCESRVGSLIKKYSQLNTQSLDTTKTFNGATAARKSRSVQAQPFTAPREKSQEKSFGQTWALDSKGHRMFLTVVSKEIDPFTQVIVYTFQNGDKKDLYPDGKVVYHYAKSQTVYTVYPCGRREIQCENGQRELHEKDGNIEVTYPNGTIRRVFCTGEEEQEAPDGTVARRLRDGTEIVHYPNGQKEVRHESYKCRSYPNGAVKTVYPSGKQITKYPDGRVRVKDADGTVLVNTSS